MECCCFLPNVSRLFFLSSLEHMELSMRKLRHYLSENATCYKVIMSQKNASFFFYDGCLLQWAHETGLNYSNRSHISRSSLACFIGSPMQKKKKKLQATSLFHFGCSAWNSDLDEAIKRYGWATLLTVNCPTSFWGGGDSWSKMRAAMWRKWS